MDEAGNTWYLTSARWRNWFYGPKKSWFLNNMCRSCTYEINCVLRREQKPALKCGSKLGDKLFASQF